MHLMYVNFSDCVEKTPPGLLDWFWRPVLTQSGTFLCTKEQPNTCWYKLIYHTLNV